MEQERERERRTTIGDQAFAVAGPRAWNTLPDFITDSLLVIPHFQTVSQDLPIHLFYHFEHITAPYFYDCAKRSSSSLCRLRRFKSVHFALHLHYGFHVLFYIFSQAKVDEADHTSEKPGNVRGFDSSQGDVQEFQSA